jgi:sugar phosphate isomerase/epimerase
MRHGDCHLSYCMNVHPAATLADVLANIERYVVPIRDRVAPGQAFGLGMWLPHAAARELADDVSPLRDTLAAHGLYLFTLNGFPYGVFHGAAVKDAVYYPDWSAAARLQYTTDLFTILAALLPPGVPGSVSTVPVTYGKVLPAGAVDNLLAAAAAADRIGAAADRALTLSLEPEPDCYLETTTEAIAFFDHLRSVAAPGAADALSICFDTCHLAVNGEDPEAAYDRLRAAGIAVGKVQISAALICDNQDGTTARQWLAAYDEPVYLHQTRVTAADGTRTHYPDLGPALAANTAGEWRVHFHVPLHFVPASGLQSTIHGLPAAFLQRLAREVAAAEIETYTFDVLPSPKPDVVESITAEFDWLLTQLATG